MKKSADFSLVAGGPLFQLFRWTRLAGDELELVRRRIFVLAFVAWAPLLLLSVAEGHAWAGSVELPFILDLEMHARLLLAVPLFIVTELMAHRRIPPLVRQFVDRGLIPDAARTKFDAAIASAMRLRNSLTAEVLLIALVYVVGVGIVWRTQLALDVASWQGEPADGRWQWSLAGWWLGCVSLPLFQFLLLRWYYRIFIWARFLWHVSRIELQLIPTHPDRCGGLGFLARVGHAFSLFLMAQGAVLAGLMANRIFYTGAKLPEFKLELIGLVAVLVLAILGPLVVFSPKIEKAKRGGLRRLRHALAALRARVRLQVAPRRGACGRAADRQPRHPVPGRSRQQLRSGDGHEVVSVHLEERTGAIGGHAGARGAADLDDDSAGGVARAVAADGVLTIRRSTARQSAATRAK